MRTIITIILTFVLVSVNLYAGNPADLTLFERYKEGGFGKLIFDEDATILSLKFPHFKNEFSIMLSKWEDEEGLEIQTVRFIKKLAPNLDVALKVDRYYEDNLSWTKNYAVLDIHGDCFGTLAGIGIHLPLDNEDSIEISPRISFGDLSAFLTISTGRDYIAGLSYRFDKKHNIEFAYDKQETLTVRVSTLVKINDMKFFPEFRLERTREETYIGFGIGFCF